MTDDHKQRDGCSATFATIAANTGHMQEGLDNIRSDMKAQADAAEDRHVQVMRILTGHPDDETKVGLVGRIDRIEQKDKARTWWFRAVVVAVLGVIGKLIHGWHAK